MFLPRAVKISVLSDFDDADRRLMDFSLCDGSGTLTVSIDTAISELKKVAWRLEEFSVSSDHLPLLAGKGRVPSQPQQAQAYDMEETVFVRREYANKVFLTVKKVRSFPAGAALTDSVSLALAPEALRTLGKKILLWLEGGAKGDFVGYLSDSSGWAASFLDR